MIVIKCVFIYQALNYQQSLMIKPETTEKQVLDQSSLSFSYLIEQKQINESQGPQQTTEHQMQKALNQANKTNHQSSFVEQVLKESSQKCSYFLDKSIDQLEKIQQTINKQILYEEDSRKKRIMLAISKVASKQIDRRKRMNWQKNKPNVYFGIIKVSLRQQPQKDRIRGASVENVYTKTVQLVQSNLKSLIPRLQIVNPFKKIDKDQNKASKAD